MGSSGSSSVLQPQFSEDVKLYTCAYLANAALVSHALVPWQAALADYGFVCQCPRCKREAADACGDGAPGGSAPSRKRPADAEADTS